MERRAYLSFLWRGFAATLVFGKPIGGFGDKPKQLKIGMSAAFSGTAAGLGTEFYRGAEAYYERSMLAAAFTGA